MEEKGRRSVVKNYTIFFVILVLIVGVVIVILSYDDWMTQADIRKIRKEFETDFPQMLVDRITDLPYGGEFQVTAESSWEKTMHEERFLDPELAYEWKDLITAVLTVDKSFDVLSEREQYDILKTYAFRLDTAYLQAKVNDFPELGKYDDWWSSRIYDLGIFHSVMHIYRIQSPEHAYGPGEERDTFFIDGKIRRIQDDITKQHIQEEREKEQKKRTTPAPTPTPKPLATYKPTPRPLKSASKATDPYEAHMFDDPDDYADYYAEEFAEEIGEDENEGYQEAYDHWVYWHETND